MYPLPTYLLDLAKTSPENKAWVASLPDNIDQFAKRWQLTLGKPYGEGGTCSYVVRCITENGQSAVLKIGLPHFEGQHEIQGLRKLDGNPTVRLLQADVKANAMLLERCDPGHGLHKQGHEEQDLIVCATLRTIWQTKVSSDDLFCPLSDLVELWNRETHAALADFPDAGLAKEGCAMKRHLAATAKEHVLLATDLHPKNILSSTRKPWLAIDIKPFLGDPAYDLTQHVLNATDRLKDNPHKMLKHLATLAEVELDRLTQWTFARLASENNGIYQELARAIEP